MQNKTGHVLSWIGLSSIPGVGRMTFRKLVRHFGSAERSLAASPGELRDVEGLPVKVVEAIGAFDWQKPAEREVAKAEETGVAIITLDDPSYPGRLRDTPDPPLFLYVRGRLTPEDDNAVAIVGTRRPTHYGKTVTRRLAGELASAGFSVASGMARGIDTEAHLGALAAEGRTIAVLGCGIDVAYPPENRGLMERISQAGRGAVMTENPFGTKPEAGYFPARNRIISGLSRGTVIIEASEDSGSLITAQYALEQNRKLFAVPGNIGSPVSRGAHSLIRQGATLVEGVEDILSGLGVKNDHARREPPRRPLPQLSPGETAVLQSLTGEPKHIDTLLEESRVTAGALGGVLITLELKGLAKQLPGKYFVRIE
jgi:DNA processing protein